MTSCTSPDIEQIQTCLRRRLLEDLHLASFPEPTQVGLAWIADQNHLGVMFEFQLDSPYVIDSLRKKEFRKRGRFESLDGSFVQPAELHARSIELGLEKWSQLVLAAEER